MDLNTADCILDFLDEFNAHFEKLADFLAEKQNRILKDDLSWLEDALVDEQSLIMKGNSLENKRLELFERLGVSEKKLSELEEIFPDERKGMMHLQSERLNDSIVKIKRLNEVSVDLVQRKMKVWDKLLGINEFTGTGAYDGDAKIAKGGAGGDIIGSV